jgi:hypothetical protein
MMRRTPFVMAEKKQVAPGSGPFGRPVQLENMPALDD